MAIRQLQGLCARGELEKGMELLSSRQTPLPANAYVSLLKACKQKRSKSRSHARQVHAHIVNHQVPLSGLLGDYLVVALALCGAVDDALGVLCQLPQRTVYSWTSLISSYGDCGRAYDALKVYEKMLQDGIDPTSLSYVAVFKACGFLLELDRGRVFHAHACVKGLTCEASVGNSLLGMYVQCSALVDAENIFFTLSERSAFSWNSMLSLCIDYGQAKRALKWYADMKSDGVEPNHHTYIILMKACESCANFEQIQALGNDARNNCYVSDVMVGSTLINMYGKLGALKTAEEVFHGLPHRDVVTWNALLGAYVAQGLGKQALQLYRQMQEDCVYSTQRTSVIALQACCMLAEQEDLPSLGKLAMKEVSYHIGQAFHAEARKKEFLSVGFLHSTLVSMYGKCGAMLEAEHVFGSLPHRDLISWNAMLSAYTDLGEGVKALQLLLQIEKESITPDERTFVTALQAATLIEVEVNFVSEGRFSKKMSLEIGHALHGGACRYSLASGDMVGTALVSMYSRCGAINEAEQVFFCGLTQHTVVAWNAMISAYVELSKGEKALQLYAQMQVEGYTADQVTFILALQACGIIADEVKDFYDKDATNKEISFVIGQALHSDILRGFFASDVSTSNTLISLYGKCGAIPEAENVFFALHDQTIVSWNAVLSAYAEQDQCEKALLMYRHMRQENLKPNLLTFLCVLQACTAFAGGKDVLVGNQADKQILKEIGQALHVDCMAEGFSSHVFIRNSFVQMYGKCGAVKEAEEVCGVLAPGSGDGSLFLQDEVAWNLMLSAYAENDRGLETVLYYRQMQGLCVPITLVSVTRLLQACSSIGNEELCCELHFLSVTAGFDQGISVAATVIHAYGSCARTVDADACLEAISRPDVIAWSANIAGHACMGESLASLYMFDMLKLLIAHPSSSTFVSVLAACTQSGLVEGSEYLESMIRDFCLIPDPNHYCSLIDLYGRAGDLRRAQLLLVDKDKVRSNSVAWLSLLGACRTHGHADLAKEAYDSALKLQPSQATAHVLMLNIYADFEKYTNQPPTTTTMTEGRSKMTILKREES